MRDALDCESRPHGQGARVSSVVVMVGGRQTIAATGDWKLSQALVRAVLRGRVDD